MGRKFIKIFEKPYLIFWGQFILINIIGFLGDEKVSIINIDSSYFVLVSFDVAILLSKIYVVIGIVYFLTSISKVILNEMAEHLIENDVENASKYQDNLKKALKEIDTLTIQVMTELNKSVSSIVFHDAYQYFEKSFNISPTGAVQLGDATDPSPAELIVLQNKVKELKINVLEYYKLHVLC